MKNGPDARSVVHYPMRDAALRPQSAACATAALLAAASRRCHGGST